MGPTPLKGRQISRDHARAIAETGGSIGIWHFFPSLDKYVEGLKEMVDVVGVDHVSIGTDQQVAPGSLQDYAQWVQLVAAMLRGGFTPEEAGKIAGGNYMRIFRCCGRLTPTLGTRSRPAGTKIRRCSAQSRARIHPEIDPAADRIPLRRERDGLADGVQVTPAFGEAALALE